MSRRPAPWSRLVRTPIGVLPADWEVKQLGENAYIKARIGWRGLSADEYTKDGPLLVAGTHIRGAHIDWMSCDHVSDFRYEESPEIQLQEGDVILSKDGTLGRVGIVERLPGRATINGTMMLVRPKRDTFESKFLYNYLQGRNFRRFIKEKVSGSSVPHIFQRDMVRLLAPSPPLPEQRQDCRHPLLSGQRHREESGGHRPDTGRQAGPDAGGYSRGAFLDGTRISNRRKLGKFRNIGTWLKWPPSRRWREVNSRIVRGMNPASMVVNTPSFRREMWQPAMD